MHVRGLPALHHGLAHDLQVSVGLIVSGARVVPGGLAVLSLGENGLCSGGHFVVLLLLRRRQRRLFGSGKTVWRTEEGERQEEAVYIGFRSADTAGVSLRVKSTHTYRGEGARTDKYGGRDAL